MAKETIGKKLYDLLATRDYDNFQALDSATGKVPVDPKTGAQNVGEANMFVFDWSSSRGKNYGTAVILLTDDHDLELYFGDNLGKTMEDREDKNEWFAFMEQLRHFATRTNFNGFRPLNINQLRHSLQGQAAIREGLFESWQGRKNMSWNGVATEARLMIRHKRDLGPDEARHRYVESLFIETAEGERYKLPFVNLGGGKAMLEHVRQGGRPYDTRGQHIANMIQEINILSRFERSVAGDALMEGDTAQLVTEAHGYKHSLKTNLKRLATGRGYADYFESWNPASITEQDVVVESLKQLFVKQTLDTRIEQALPLLAKIQQQGQAMKEATIFEAWANRLVEGTWSLPDTPEKQQQLIDFMSQEQPVGADATDATEQLYDILGDDQLFDRLSELADQHPDSDCRQLVLDRMQELSDDPDVREALEKLNVNTDATMHPAAATPADLGGDSDGGDIDESMSDHQHHVWTVHFADGTQRRVPVGSDEFDYEIKRIQDHFAKQGLEVVDVDTDTAIHGEPPAEPEDYEKTEGVAEGHADQQRKVFKKNGKPVGEVGIDRESSPGVGQYYMKHYASGKDLSGYDSYEEAVAELKHCLKQGVAEGSTTRGGFGGSASQAHHEIEWLKNKIETLKPLLTKKPGVARQIRDLERQIRERELAMAYHDQGVAEDAIQSLRRAAGLNENVLRDSTGSTLDHIADKFKRDIRDFEATGNLSDDLFDALYDYYQDDMPYGVQKARSGDPHDWIADRITQDLGLQPTDLDPFEKFKLRNNAARDQAGMPPNPDFQEERDPHSVDGGMANALLADDAVCNMSDHGHHCPVHGIEECWGAESMPGMEEGAVGAVAGAVLAPELGPLASRVGSMAQDAMTDSDDDLDEEGFGLNPTPAAMEEERSPLAGIYGHSGKMKEVGRDVGFLDRLKELAGMRQA